MAGITYENGFLRIEKGGKPMYVRPSFVGAVMAGGVHTELVVAEIGVVRVNHTPEEVVAAIAEAALRDASGDLATAKKAAK